MSTDKWVCYLLYSLESNSTYIGSTNNAEKRLNAHNSGKGAKYTMGETWCPYLIIHGFENKIMCLSFESQWKRLSKRRNNSRMSLVNQVCSERIAGEASDESEDEDIDSDDSSKNQVSRNNLNSSKNQVSRNNLNSSKNQVSRNNLNSSKNQVSRNNLNSSKNQVSRNNLNSSKNQVSYHMQIKYDKNPLRSRILDLIYMMYHITINDKNKISVDKDLKMDFKMIPLTCQIFIHREHNFFDRICLPPWFTAQKEQNE